jgi:hypothetical protein
MTMISIMPVWTTTKMHTQHTDTQHTYTQHTDTQQPDTKHKESQHNYTQDYESKKTLSLALITLSASF